MTTPGVPTADEPDPAGGHRVANRWLMRRARGARPALALAVACGVATGVLVIGQAAATAVIVAEAVLGGAGPAELWPAFAVLLAIIAGRAIAAWGGEVAGFAAAARVKLALRDELYRHVQALGPAFTDGRHSGGLASAMVEQVEALEGYYARYLPQMVVATLVPLVMLAVVFWVNWVAGLILLGTAPFIPVFMALIGMGAAKASRRQFRTLARMGGYFLDRLQGLATLRLFGAAERELDRVTEISHEFRRRTMSVLRIAFLSSAVLELFSAIAVALTAIYVGLSLIGFIGFGTGPEGLGLMTGLFVLLLAPDVFVPLRQLATHYHDRAAAVGAAEELLTVLDQPAPARARAGGRPVPDIGPARVAFEDVHLAFEHGRRPVLSGVDLALEPGERVALVGPSGTGKSTLIHLLLGFLVPDAGTVRLNGVDLAEADPEAARRLIGWVGQRCHLFHGTVRDNIRLGRPDAGDLDIERAAALARVDEFTAALPDGLDTAVGERGLGLSGGQAQRVALARAFLKDAPLLLLDEPTANLDSHNERLILDAIERLAEGRTVLMATHSAAGIRRVDRVARLAGGRLVERAEPERLRREATG